MDDTQWQAKEPKRKKFKPNPDFEPKGFIDSNLPESRQSEANAIVIENTDSPGQSPSKDDSLVQKVSFFGSENSRDTSQNVNKLFQAPNYRVQVLPEQKVIDHAVSLLNSALRPLYAAVEGMNESPRDSLMTLPKWIDVGA